MKWMNNMLSSLNNQKFGLTNNQLKIIAAISMVLDHIGLVLFPGEEIFRILGRIALPIYAFLIAEGCRHTRNRKKYLGLIASMGIAFQVFYFVFMDDLYQGILITFSLSICLIYSIESFINNKNILNRILMSLVIFGVLFVTLACPDIFGKYGFEIDYGIWGVSLPVIVYFAPDHDSRVLFLSIFLGIRGFFARWTWWPLMSIPFIALYNGERGKKNMKYFFYLFYPLHLVIIYAVAILISILK